MRLCCCLEVSVWIILAMPNVLLLIRREALGTSGTASSRGNETAVRTSHWMFRSRFNLLTERIHARPCVWSFCLKFPPQEGKTDGEKRERESSCP